MSELTNCPKVCSAPLIFLLSTSVLIFHVLDVPFLPQLLFSVYLPFLTLEHHLSILCGYFGGCGLQWKAEFISPWYTRSVLSYIWKFLGYLLIFLRKFHVYGAILSALKLKPVFC